MTLAVLDAERPQPSRPSRGRAAHVRRRRARTPSRRCARRCWRRCCPWSPAPRGGDGIGGSRRADGSDAAAGLEAVVGGTATVVRRAGGGGVRRLRHPAAPLGRWSRICTHGDGTRRAAQRATRSCASRVSAVGVERRCAPQSKDCGAQAWPAIAPAACCGAVRRACRARRARGPGCAVAARVHWPCSRQLLGESWRKRPAVPRDGALHRLPGCFLARTGVRRHGGRPRGGRSAAVVGDGADGDGDACALRAFGSLVGPACGAADAGVAC